MSWKARGWCRFERFSQVLTHDDGRMLLVQREDTVVEMGAYDYLFDPVGLGAFTVEADRARLAVVTRRLYEEKLHRLDAAGRIEELRMMLALRASLLEGLPLGYFAAGFTSPVVADRGTEGFLQRFRFSSRAQRTLGMTPLLLASFAGDTEVVQALLCEGAHVNCRQRRNVPDFSLFRGETAIHLAATNGRTDAVAALLAWRADPATWAGCGFSALHAWTNKGSEAVLQMLLGGRADIDGANAFGWRPIELCVVFGRLDGIRLLLESRASCASTCEGLNALHAAGALGGGREIVCSLLRARASPNALYSPRLASPVWLVAAIFGVSYRLGRRSFVTAMCYHTWGATPLMWTVLSGCRAEAEAMLEHGADPDLRNRRGASARSLARELGTGDIAGLFLT